MLVGYRVEDFAKKVISDVNINYFFIVLSRKDLRDIDLHGLASSREFISAFGIRFNS